MKSLLNVTAFNKYNNKICFNQGTFDTRDVTTMFYDDYLQVLDVQQSKSNLIVKFNKVDKHSRDVDIKWFSKEGKNL